MILPYEIIHRSVVPAIRYMTAINLIEKHGFTQKEAASKLGVTQAAISNYVRRTRAVAVKIDSVKHVKESVEKLTELLLDGDVNNPEITETFTEICEYMRKKRLLCSFHKKMEPEYTIDKCHACDRPVQISI
jgi:predicted transcriptional regulator